MSVWTDIRELLLPMRCQLCGGRMTPQEGYICPRCMALLPLTDYHKVEHSELEKVFWGRFPVGRAVSMFHHDGERTRHLIHAIKYEGQPHLGTYLAARYAEELDECNFFEGIDAIVPLPLHWVRQWGRHYNQSHYIAEGIAQVTGLPVLTRVVRRVRNNPSQTRLTASQRMKNTEGLFQLVHPEAVAGKHILLVDDVMTTGATLTSCAQALAQATEVTISVLTLATAAHTPVPAVEGDHVEVSVFGVPLLE